MALSEDKNVWLSFIYEVVPEAIVPKHFQIFDLESSCAKKLSGLEIARVEVLLHISLLERRVITSYRGVVRDTRLDGLQRVRDNARVRQRPVLQVR